MHGIGDDETIRVIVSDFHPTGLAGKEAVTAEPKSFEAHLALGEFYARKRDLPQAEREFKEASGLAPVGSPARVQLAALATVVGLILGSLFVLIRNGLRTNRARRYEPASKLQM